MNNSLTVLAAACLALLTVTDVVGGRPVDFATDVAPILVEHCLRCHSPGNAKGDMSLATMADLQERGYVSAGDPAGSYLIELVTATDDQRPAMPQDGEPLAETEVTLLRRWIETGGQWPRQVVLRVKSRADANWWAYQPLKLSADHASIDEFIRARLAEHDLEMNPPADRRVLIRRATYDLIGLPPDPEHVEAFVNDPDPQAYERLIDRLLASPHYGERWGRHWLDVVRFGESNGFERNVLIKDLWPFRDYVIRSLNADKPFDQFIREHIAGDVFGQDDPMIAIGTAFLVAGPYDDVGNQDAEQAAQIRANTLDEMIRATGEAFLGLTLGCARCHDHKFDPITQEDYYGLYATLSGVRHGAVELTTPRQREERATRLEPLESQRAELDQAVSNLDAAIVDRARQRLPEYAADWTRTPVDRTGTEDRVEPVLARFVRLVSEAQDVNPQTASGFGIDEFEIWSTGADAKNVALARNGAKASGEARRIEDFPGAYGPQLAIDGKTGARFLATGVDLTIELAEPTLIDRILFSSARGEANPEHPKFAFVAEYRIEVSLDGVDWREVASGADRQPITLPSVIDHRLLKLESTESERTELARFRRQLADIRRAIAAVPELPTAWIGRRIAEDAHGPFHVFLGGDPQHRGEEVVPASLSALHEAFSASYQLSADVTEAERRLALADWIVHPDNPLTPRVLVNRLWHYHFGTGLVDTPSDFGYMGGRPTHPELLDYLAIQLLEQGWHIKPLHRMIMLSEAYRQSSTFREAVARSDGNARLLWRFPPRRLSAEEVRDTMLHVAGTLNTTCGGPGFRLYRFLQDNVCTYVPLDEHGPETYRRTIYHQNARASVVDLMTEFDQPDCAYAVPRRTTTTTPLQALTLLNHSFTVDMSRALAVRLRREAGTDPDAQICRAFQLCYVRPPSDTELSGCRELINAYSLEALCRVLLNTSELLYVP